jgi:hypothetical protein
MLPTSFPFCRQPIYRMLSVASGHSGTIGKWADDGLKGPWSCIAVATCVSQWLDHAHIEVILFVIPPFVKSRLLPVDIQVQLGSDGTLHTLGPSWCYSQRVLRLR